MLPIVRQLSDFEGSYVGDGRSPGGEPRQGRLRLGRHCEGRCVIVSYTEIGPNGAVVVLEEAFVGPDFQGRPSLWLRNAQFPRVTQLALAERDGAVDVIETLLFAAPAPEASPGRTVVSPLLRVEVAIERFRDGDLGYRVALALHGGALTTRTSLRMHRQHPITKRDHA